MEAVVTTPIGHGADVARAYMSVAKGRFDTIQIIASPAGPPSRVSPIAGYIPKPFKPILTMEDLPDKALSNVASYLEKTTRALLAAALSAPSTSWEKYDSTQTPCLASRTVSYRAHITIVGVTPEAPLRKSGSSWTFLMSTRVYAKG